MARVLIPLPDCDFDPTEAAVPWRLLTRAGHDVVFATEHGEAPVCDPLLVSGVMFGELGAKKEPKGFYAEMAASKSRRLNSSAPGSGYRMQKRLPRPIVGGWE